MDTVKIGRYIAEKRKGLGLTQKQLAEKLGMSDKSVSKWETGVCLPDVSVFPELCEILGIGIHEFLAGEDLVQENILRKSEENIIVVATDSKVKQKRLKLVIGILLAVMIAALALLGIHLVRSNQPQNYIIPVDRDSVEMKTAELLSGADGAFMFRFAATEPFTALNVFVSEYHSGQLVSKEDFGFSHEGMESPQSGTILVVPDFKRFTVKFILADEGAKLSTDIPILDGVENREYYGRSATQMDGKTDIEYNDEQGLLALIYGRNEIRVTDLHYLMDRDAEEFSKNDYLYVFSVQFCK